MKTSHVTIVSCVMLCALAVCVSSGCRRSVMRLDTGEKLKARVINADDDNVYVVTPQKQVRAVPRQRIETHRPPGTLTMVFGGLYTVVYGAMLLDIDPKSDLASWSFMSGFVLGSLGVLVTGGIIRHQAVKRYRRGLQVEDAVRRVRVEPVLSTGSSHQAGIRVRF